MPFIPLDDSDVMAQVRHLAKHSNGISWTRHAQEQMATRGIDKGMVKECLQFGDFSEAPHLANRSGVQYKFTMVSVVEGEYLSVAASLCPDTRVVIITAYEGR